ncbi:helix-turn-helix domain-containing protein [Ornithinimicrobium ciconiae]|uniref:Helix-turn-helix domain-containing protein n=1 Tax=Ornithinimicrobium ciconiae TaxID=2594265 RepID=A0A516GAD7_9MICO|nr:helix-turn-helix domain-containing protein [Ornithinimicrobium ciconiae]QDO88481.1 helix-turn-helix domain-containing protein [Ornithinimicrobium ciconiae]
MTGEPFERAVDSIASLAEPVRRELYRYVCQRDVPVGREEAAEATGLAHHTVKFHLDRLAADGLLEVDYQRLGDRTGPGAGRPAKVYRRVEEEVSISLPARDYALAGELLAATVDAAAMSGRPVLEVLTEVATARGAELARDASAPDASAAQPGGPGGSDVLAIASEALARHGFEPRSDGDRVLLTNCPFHALAQRHTQLVCGMNHAMLEGFTGELAPGCLAAHLDPAPGRCCVTLSQQR